MSLTICLIEGDGIGHEVIPAAARVLETLDLDIMFTRADIGYGAYQATGQALPDAAVAAIQAADATLFGAVTTPVGLPNYRSPVVAMRRALDLYANLRPVRSLPIPGCRPDIDLWIVRENTEDLYVGQETNDGQRATALRVITRAASERIARTAYDLARRRRLARVTIVHKANVLRETDGLFRAACLDVARDYPDVATDEQLVDSMAMKLILQPERFGIVVTTNLFGDILSDEAAALVGGLGTLAAGNIGPHAAVFEPVHGSAPDIAGQGIANPTAALLAAGLLLDHVGQPAAAERLHAAVIATLAGGVLTPDLGGQATTAAVTAAVIAHLRPERRRDDG